MKRIVSGLLALCLLCALPVTAAARSNPTLFCRERGGEVRLTLESLDRQAYALQLELVLEGECPEARFEPSLRGVYSPDCHVEAGRDETAVTLYLMAEDEPLSGRSLDLGTLMPGSDFRLPGRGELLLLDRSLQPIFEGRVSLEAERDEPDPVPVQSGLAFQDVRPGDWCYDAVRRVFEAGLMNGTSADTFTPDAPTTRGQIVAILYRLEGSPAPVRGDADSPFVLVGGEPAGQASFSDVAPGAYYADAVSWASAGGIVNGYGDGTFRPNHLITREQLAAFLYRYASQKGRDMSGRTTLSAFADAGQVAPYAVEPLSWAVSAGLVNGVSADTLSPGGNASRAQVAAILSRFMQNVL
ncbi:S-layer homology domain-containing protein [Oscillibacter sp.]|uniref:S-layer homology domain-containing protein n=1 Tax=Oscillibacter sp. TaxID=1945593 RepID=UPI002D80BC98|nr:S-layer homology domain-containing protein [Oscillibacter sp.]